MKHLHKYFSSFAFILTLTACGSGGGGGDGPGDGSDLTAPSLATPAAQEFTVDTTITTFILTNSGGGEFTSCSASTFPEGLSIAVAATRTTCQISGTPTQLQDATGHSITATNAAGSSTVSIEIAVVVAAPDLQNTAELSFEQNESISIEFGNLGGPAEQCAGTLVDGLSVDTSTNGETCVLSGAIANVQNDLEINVTASNASGESSATAFLSITPTIIPLAAPALQNIDAGELTVGASSTINMQNTGGGELSQCSSSDLPSGLTVAVSSDATTCVVSGTPTTPQAQGNSQVTATNASGSSSASVTITVAAVPVLLPAPELAAVIPQTFVQQTAVSLTLANNGGGMLSACSASNLPTGLSASVNGDTSTCILSGTPTTEQSATNATITATNSTGSDSVTISITVEAPPPAAPSLDSVSALTLIQNESFSRTLTNSGGGELSACTATVLPDGLSVAVSSDEQNCELSGIPTTIQAATDVTITVTNETDSSSVTVSVTVAPPAPSLTDITGLSFAERENFTVEFDNTGGGELTECNADLPGGLSVSRNAGNTSCVVTGFIGVPQQDLVLSIVAVNSTGESTGTITLDITGDAPFITTWDTTQTTGGNTTSLTLYTATGPLFDFSVDWGDGTINENVTANITHIYDTPGVYTVKISGLYPQPCISTTCGGSDAQKIVSVEQWGDRVWQSMVGAFRGSPDFVINDPAGPDLSEVTSMARMFRSSSFNQPIDNWDVSNVEIMEGMFRENSAFNQDIGSWDVRAVTDMSEMFLAASAFDQNIGSWELDSIEDITLMFGGATVFNQDIGSWDVSNITDMTSLFVSARAFNQDLSSWVVTNVTNMQSTFEDAQSFNQDLSAWNVSNVEIMNSMFANALAFNGNIGGWTTTSLTETESTFEGAAAFNQDISGWNVSNVTNMLSMFENATSFDQNIGPWDISNVGIMGMMLSGSGLSVANYDNLLEAWSMLSVQSDVTLDVTQNYSSSSQSFRDVLTNAAGPNWTINDLGVQ